MFDNNARREPTNSGSIALVVAMLLAGPAWAQPDRVDLQTFHAAATSGGLVHLEGTAIGPTLWPRVGLQLAYQRSPLEDDQPGQLGVKNRFNAEAAFSMSFFDRAEIGMAVPLVLYQADQEPETSPQSAGFGDLRIVSKLRLVGHELGFSLALLGVVKAPTGAEYLMAGSGWGGEALGLAAYGWRALSLHAAVGYRVQPTRKLGSVVVDDQILLGLGARLRVGPFALLGEITAATAADAPFGSTERTPALGTLGVSYTVRAITVSLAGGPGIYAGHGSPTAHVGLGVAFTPAEADGDSDGIPDHKDGCPSLREDRDGFADDDGCPDRDNDADGIFDADDLCPDRAEDYDKVADHDGCPE
jgi:hypothetical protein